MYNRDTLSFSTHIAGFYIIILCTCLFKWANGCGWCLPLNMLTALFSVAIVITVFFIINEETWTRRGKVMSTDHTANKGTTGFTHRTGPSQPFIKHCARLFLKMTERIWIFWTELSKKRSPNQLFESFFTIIFFFVILYCGYFQSSFLGHVF